MDTSSFVDYFRGKGEFLIPQLALKDKIILSRVVRLELIKGVSRQGRHALVNFLDGLIQLAEFASAATTEKLLLLLHGRGINLGIADLLILADAQRTKSKLLTADRALQRAAELVKIPLLHCSIINRA